MADAAIPLDASFWNVIPVRGILIRSNTLLKDRAERDEAAAGVGENTL
jgi:hypothetical protein